jgi:hypothetical protein
MKKKAAKKLSLNRETVRRLEDRSLLVAEGALAELGIIVPVRPKSDLISICIGCTGPLDTCPKTLQTDCTCA